MVYEDSPISLIGWQTYRAKTSLQTTLRWLTPHPMSVSKARATLRCSDNSSSAALASCRMNWFVSAERVNRTCVVSRF